MYFFYLKFLKIIIKFLKKKKFKKIFPTFFSGFRENLKNEPEFKKRKMYFGVIDGRI